MTLILFLLIIFAILLLAYAIHVIALWIYTSKRTDLNIEFFEFLDYYHKYPDAWNLEDGYVRFRHYYNGDGYIYLFRFSLLDLIRYEHFKFRKSHEEKMQRENKDREEFLKAINDLQRKDDQPDA